MTFEAAMLLEREKNGTGPKRMSRASAFLEAAGMLDAMSGEAWINHRQRLALTKAADRMRDKAVEERKAYDAQQPKPGMSLADVGALHRKIYS